MGEHAVVYGHPALVTSVDRRLRVTLVPGEDGVLLRLPRLSRSCASPWQGVLNEARAARERWEDRFLRRLEPGEPVPRLPPEHLVLLALGEAALHLGQEPREPVVLTVESDLPVGAGFGSSAALAAAVSGAWLAWNGVTEDRVALAAICLEVERRQHGTPSGVDHSAVLQGGLLEARLDAQGALACRPLARPPLLSRFSVFDSGPPVEPTGTVVAAVRRRLEAGDPTILEALERIAWATRDFCDQLSRPGGEDAETVKAAIQSCQRALEALGVVPAPARAAVRELEGQGLAAKISGAGALTGSGAGSVLVYSPPGIAPTLPSTPPTWRALELSFAGPGLTVSVGSTGEGEPQAAVPGEEA